MRKVTTILKWTLGVLVLSLGLSANLTADESCDVKKKDGTEKSRLIQQLREARMAGNMEAYKRIEAQLPKAPAAGESLGGTTLHETHTVSGAGDLKALMKGALQLFGFNGQPLSIWTDFGGDIKVRTGNYSHKEWHQTVVSDSNDNLYVAWQDDFFDNDYIQVYMSEDGGYDWTPFGFVVNGSAHLRQPCLAVGEGEYYDNLLLAYMRDPGGGGVPEVATAPLSGHTFTVHSVPVWGYEGYAKPVIHTDDYIWSSWFAYLTCEGIYSSSSENINVCAWRSLDGGKTWINETVVFGGSDSDAWLDPDLAYGTTEDWAFICTYNQDTHEVWNAFSDDWGFTWTHFPLAALTLSPVPTYPVDPEIEAAIDYDNVMICCGKHTDHPTIYDNVGFIQSENAGLAWSDHFSLPGCGHADEFAAQMTINKGGNNFHVVYTSSQDHTVRYCYRPQDFSDIWRGADTVDDLRKAGVEGEYSKKGITSTWTSDEVCVAWADARDNDPNDLDTYVDVGSNLGLTLTWTYLSPDHSGFTDLYLDAGPENGARGYIILGSLSGYEPGTPLPGGHVTMPIVFDLFTYINMLLINTHNFQSFMGFLDPIGQVHARFNVPNVVPGTFTVHFAAALNEPWDYVSNAVGVVVTP